MENKNRIIMWMTLSTYLALAIAQHVDNAVNVNSVPKSGSESASLERKPHEKYMIDLYNIMFDKKGKPRKGIATMDDGISCFLPGIFVHFFSFSHFLGLGAASGRTPPLVLV